MDNLTKEQRRKNMQHIRSKNSLAEKKLSKALRGQGIYFAKHVTSLPGKPDIVFRRKRVAVFVDSDFWHGHPRRFIQPKSNLAYWVPKIKRNKIRDKQVNKLLKSKGWEVVRVWEYDIHKNIESCLRKINKRLS